MTEVLSGEPVPSAVPARKHHNGGAEPGAPGKLAAVKIHHRPRPVWRGHAAPRYSKVESVRG